MTTLQKQLHAQREDILILFHYNGWKISNIFILLKEFFGYKGSYKTLARFIKSHPLVVFTCINITSSDILNDVNEKSLLLLRARKSIKRRNRRSILSRYRTHILQKYSQSQSFKKTHAWFLKRYNVSISYSAFRRYITRVLF